MNEKGKKFYQLSLMKDAVHLIKQFPSHIITLQLFSPFGPFFFYWEDLLYMISKNFLKNLYVFEKEKSFPSHSRVGLALPARSLVSSFWNKQCHRTETSDKPQTRPLHNHVRTSSHECGLSHKNDQNLSILIRMPAALYRSRF